MYRLFLLKSCCGYTLEFGSLSVLIIELVFQLTRLVISFGRKYDSYFEIIWIFFIISLVIIAFHGVKVINPAELIPYIPAQCINLILYGYFGFWAIKNTSSSDLWSFINLGLFYTSSFTISFFSLCVIISYFVELTEGDDSLRPFLLREI